MEKFMVQKESESNLTTPWPAACRPSPTQAKKTKVDYYHGDLSKRLYKEEGPLKDTTKS
jgi:hypothetical protein